MWNKFKDSQPIDFEKIYIKHNQEVIERYYIGRRYGFFMVCTDLDVGMILTSEAFNRETLWSYKKHEDGDIDEKNQL